MFRSTARLAALAAAVIAVLILVPHVVHAARVATVVPAFALPQSTIPRAPGTVPPAPTTAPDDTADDEGDEAATDADTTDDASADATTGGRAPLFRLPRRPVATPNTGSPVRRPATLAIDGTRVRSLIGDPHSSTLYAVTVDRQLFRSEDGGRGWDAWVAEPQITTFIMSAASPDVLYAGTGADCEPVVATAPFVRSTDGGVTWDTLPTAAGLMPMLVHPGAAEVLFAADCDLPFLSDDGGVSWAAKPDLSPERIWTDYRVQGMAAATLADGDAPTLNYLYVAGAAADGTGIIAYSGDMGDTWARITPLVSPAPAQIRALAADRNSAGRLWFVDSNGVWSTEDFGAMWTLFTGGLDALVDDGRFAADAVTSLVYVNGRGLYLGTDAGLFLLEDGADAWARVAVAGDDAPAVRNLLALDSVPELIWVTTEQGVHAVATE